MTGDLEMRGWCSCWRRRRRRRRRRSRRDSEQAGREIEQHGHALQAVGFRGGEGHVGDDLARGFDAAAQVEERAGPGAGGEEGEVGVEGGAVGELDAGHASLRGWVARGGGWRELGEEETGGGAALPDRSCLGACEGGDSGSSLAHRAAGVGPAAAPVYVACFSTAAAVCA